MESERFVTHVMENEGTLAALLTRRKAWLDAETARLYGMPAPDEDAGVVAVELPMGERAGILTRAAFLAGFFHRGATSPPIRGNEINLRLLCRLPNPTPGNLNTRRLCSMAECVPIECSSKNARLRRCTRGVMSPPTGLVLASNHSVLRAAARRWTAGCP